MNSIKTLKQRVLKVKLKIPDYEDDPRLGVKKWKPLKKNQESDKDSYMMQLVQNIKEHDECNCP